MSVKKLLIKSWWHWPHIQQTYIFFLPRHHLKGPWEIQGLAWDRNGYLGPMFLGWLLFDQTWLDHLKLWVKSQHVCGNCCKVFAGSEWSYFSTAKCIDWHPAMFLESMLRFLPKWSVLRGRKLKLWRLTELWSTSTFGSCSWDSPVTIAEMFGCLVCCKRKQEQVWQYSNSQIMLSQILLSAAYCNRFPKVKCTTKDNKIK